MPLLYSSRAIPSLPHLRSVYLVVIGYAYVIFMMTLAVFMAGAWLKGLAIALFLGILPLWLTAKVLRRHRARRDRVVQAADTTEEIEEHP